MIRLIEKGCTTNLKGFKSEYGFVEGLIRFDKDFSIQLEPKKKIEKKYDSSEKLVCPKCKKGEILKGKIAYGCSNYKIGCDFIFSFENIKKSAYQLLINFDSLGKLKSSAQIKDLYSSEELIGKQIIAVVNTGERNIGSFISECLVLGITIEDGVSLLKPDLKTTDGIQVV